MKKRLFLLALIIAIGVVIGLYVYYNIFYTPTNRTKKVLQFLWNPESYEDAVIPALTRCGNAPFILPTSGIIGFIWGDSFRPGHHHQGIDIFSGEGVGQTPIYAAYGGYLTRLEDWKSTVIIRIPSDPLQPDRQIWTYYTHMADSSGVSLIIDDYLMGTTDVFVTAGTLLGYQGNYSGKSEQPTGVHLHFSIIMDDGQGMFLNELEIRNTLDPSPYFGLSLNADENKDLIPVCSPPTLQQ
jgi:peptidoglycan LD-endopeptidase LytH